MQFEDVESFGWGPQRLTLERLCRIINNEMSFNGHTGIYKTKIITSLSKHIIPLSQQLVAGVTEQPMVVAAARGGQGARGGGAGGQGARGGGAGGRGARGGGAAALI